MKRSYTGEAEGRFSILRLSQHTLNAAGDVETGFVLDHAEALAAPALSTEEREAVLASAALSDRDFLERVDAVPEPQASIGGWQN